MSRDADQTRGRGFLRTRKPQKERRAPEFDWRTVKPSRLGRKDRRRLGFK